MKLLWQKRKAEVKITPEVVKAAAGNWRQGVELMDFLLSQPGAKVTITPEVINSQQSIELIKLLSKKREAEVDITPGVFEAAANNPEQGMQLMRALVTALSIHGPLHVLPQHQVLSSTLCRYKFPGSSVWLYLHHG